MGTEDDNADYVDCEDYEHEDVPLNAANTANMADDSMDVRIEGTVDDMVVAGSKHTKDAGAAAQGEHSGPVELALVDTAENTLDSVESWVEYAD